MQATPEDKRQFEAKVAQLTRTQKQVLEMFVQGCDDGAIAASLEIVENTVRQHISRIADKFGIRSNSDLIEEGYSRREIIVELFQKFAPEQVISPKNISTTDIEVVDPFSNDPNFVGREEAIANIGDPVNLTENNLDVDLIAYDSTWVGRHKIISTLKQKINHLVRIVILNGITGIGKTALAEKLYQESNTEKKWTKLLRVNFDNQDKSDFSDFVAVADYLLQEFGVLVTPEDRRDIPRLKTRLIEYLEENPCLIIIDSLEWILKGNQEHGWSEFKDREWVDFFRIFLSIPQIRSRIIITTQHLPEDVSAGYDNFWLCQTIQGLDFFEQVELFEKFGLDTKSKNGGSYLERLGKVYEGHPLTLKVIAGTIKTIYQGNIIAYWEEEAKKEVEKVERDLQLSQKNIKTAWNLHKTNRDLYFKVCYRLNKTFERLKQYNYHSYLLICLISTYLKPHSKEDCLEHLVDEGCNQKEQRIALDTLVEEQLLETSIQEDITLFRLHNLVRSIAYEHFEKLD